jgi:CBS domain-containing protein
MSMRAAARLEAWGFPDVYRYTLGKVDWFAAGLPSEGELARFPRLGSIARADAPTCRIEESIESVNRRLEGSGWSDCVVVDANRIVLGLLRRGQIEGDPNGKAGDVMHLGPRTYRADEFPIDATEYMKSRNLPSVIVSDSDARLLGLARREDAEELVRKTPQHEHSPA